MEVRCTEADADTLDLDILDMARCMAVADSARCMAVADTARCTVVVDTTLDLDTPDLGTARCTVAVDMERCTADLDLSCPADPDPCRHIMVVDTDLDMAEATLVLGMVLDTHQIGDILVQAMVQAMDTDTDGATLFSLPHLLPN